MASYPDAIKSFTNPTSTDKMTSPSHSDQHSDANDEIIAIETELGVNPKGGSASVVARLDALDTTKVNNDGTVNPTNLLSNGDFEAWSAGTSAAPSGWTLSGAGASVAKETTIVKLGTASAKVTRAASATYLYQSVHATKGAVYWQGRTITYGAWVWCATASSAKLTVYDGVGYAHSSFHTGDSTWQWISVTKTLDASATALQLELRLDLVSIAYIDGAMCVEGASTFAFSPKPEEEGVWADYSAVSTVVGWSSFTFKKIYTKKIGKTVFVNFYITGTSDNATTTFTVPYARAIGIPYINFLHNAKDNGGTIVAATGYMSNLSAIVILTKNCNQSAFTASGDKYVSGQFFYEAA